MNNQNHNKKGYLGEIRQYTIPKLVTGKDWYILFYAFDPACKELKRKRIRLNNIEKIGDRRKYADGLIKRLLVKLEKGWNPWIESENEKAYRYFSDTCEHYRKHITKLLNDGIIREDTFRDYISKLKNIEEWNKSKKSPVTYIYQFDRSFITDFLEEIYIGRKNSAQTRNNYLTFIRIFCSFLLEYEYVKVKPSDGISSLNKRKLKKIRTTIEEEDLKRLYDYLQINNKHFLLASSMLIDCFVRPKEMSLIQLKHFNLQKQTLVIPGDNSKNGKSGVVTVPEELIHFMVKLNIFDYPDNYYLFSDEFKPGKEHRRSKQFTDYWSYHVRKDLKFPVSYQFYSLKETGITNMLRKYDVITVRDQARHSSIQMTDKYTPHDVKTANKVLTKHKGLL